ncbi:hypothetical protein ACQPZX_47380 [Actinoplanes sp. CA-142083]|uniref:hypothetical protein n=1 Tax=Actinoplanes sp. CA-142083 TaxID=3239903 RepID=UPI003D91A406
MRKFWYAGAVVASGMFLFGVAGPAQADLLPGTGTAEQQADEQLARILGQSNGINVENPLRYSTMGTTPVGSTPVLQFKAGQNTPDLNPVLPGESTEDARPDAVLPAADVVGPPRRLSDGLPVRNLNMPQTSVANMQVFRGLFDGLLPSGDMSGAMQQPTLRQAETFDGGMPLLGGLGGLLPVNGLPRTGDGPDTSGLPAGGIAIVPAAAAPTFGQAPANPATPANPVGPANPVAAANPAGAGAQLPATVTGQQDQPAQQKPGQQKPAQQKPAAAPDDPRLHEEPVDGEATAPRRAFSADGRPVAGIDEQYR